jgi:hypothetical protein
MGHSKRPAHTRAVPAKSVGELRFAGNAGVQDACTNRYERRSSPVPRELTFEASARPYGPFCELPQLLSYFSGTSTGAPLSLTKNTMNFAGLVLLAFRPTT